MWTIMMAEMKYHIHRLALILFLVPGFYLYAIYSGSQSWFIIPVIASIVVFVQVAVVRENERIERFHALLPLPPARIAAARILSSFLTVVLIYVLYFSLSLSINKLSITWTQGGNELLMFFGLSVMSYSVYIIQKDVLVGRGKSLRIILDKVVLFLSLVVFINGIPLMFALTIGDRGIPIVFHFIIIGGGLGLMAMTLVSYQRRISYLR